MEGEIDKPWESSGVPSDVQIVRIFGRPSRDLKRLAIIGNDKLMHVILYLQLENRVEHILATPVRGIAPRTDK
jgi:hypothetical protein